jgi:hypothetical protein
MRRPCAIRQLPVLVLALVICACGEAAAPASPSPGATAPGQPASSPIATHGAPAAATPVATASPTAVPTPAALTLGGTWARPKEGARLTSHAVTTAARPAASGPGTTTFTKVVFKAAWTGGKKRTMCTASAPGPDGTWSCRANLLSLGVPPGKVTLSFDVHGEGAPAARSPDGTRQVTYAVPPPKPTHISWTQLLPPVPESGPDRGTYRVRWSAPAGYADEFVVYYTEQCPVPSTKKNSGKPCYAAGTPVDVTQLKVLAKVSGDSRSARVKVAESDCEGIYGSILLRARNGYGSSTFAIVLSARVSWYDPDDTIC